MTFEELVKTNRSYRKYGQQKRIGREKLLSWIDLARNTPSTANLQPFKFFISTEDDLNEKIFKLTAWARNLKNYNGPLEGEKPTAYVVLCFDKRVSENPDRFGIDAGIIGQTLLLKAREDGFGGIFIKSFKKPELSEIVGKGEYLEPYVVIALGDPNEKIILEDATENGGIAYYRDEENVHHVPKRTLDELIIN